MQCWFIVYWTFGKIKLQTIRSLHPQPEPGQSAGGALGASSPDNLPAVLPLPTQICVNRPLPAPRTRQSPMVCLWKECMLGRSISWSPRERWFSSSLQSSFTSTAKEGEASAVHLQPPPPLRQLLQMAFNKPCSCRDISHSTHPPLQRNLLCCPCFARTPMQ